MPGLCVFDPGLAWSVGEQPKADSRLQTVNNAAISACDLMVAVLPSHVSSIGVPLEIDFAARLGREVFVLRDKLSFGLASIGPNVHQFTHMSSLCMSVREYLSKIEKTGVSPSKTTTIGRMTAVVESNVAQPLTQPYPDDAGWDLRYTGDQALFLAPGQVVEVPCNVKIQWPEGVWGLIIGRSSSFRNRHLLVNVSVIDPGFRGELFALVRNVNASEFVRIEPGERVAQIVPLPALAPLIDIQYGKVDKGSRGNKGFGSSGL
jgi:dUTP pyrophosphatase